MVRKSLFVRLTLAAFVTASAGVTGFGPAIAEPSFGSGPGAIVSLPAPADRLREALERYKAIEASGGWTYLSSGRVVELGVIDRRVAALRRRLAIEGDLPDTERDGEIFDRALAEAVRVFQRRHGLDPDGRVGLRTLAALNVPVERRIRQIAVNLERWRAQPHALPSRRLEVNIPAAELVLLDDEFPVMTMRVVVGSRRYPTPTLESRITSIVFNPPWNVPVRIARYEIVPRLKHEPSYLRDNDIRILDRPDDPYGETINWKDAKAPRVPPLQQQPGPKNALGRIKFNFMNGYSVYLHDTPGKEIFDRENRALSHGCVRLQQPEDLARYVLRDRLSADPDLIDRALASEETREVTVGDPLPIYIVYRTAFVGHDGQLQFRNDLYGYDARMQALPSADVKIANAPVALETDCKSAG